MAGQVGKAVAWRAKSRWPGAFPITVRFPLLAPNSGTQAREPT
jgi:hypothetical protein